MDGWGAGGAVRGGGGRGGGGCGRRCAGGRVIVVVERRGLVGCHREQGVRGGVVAVGVGDRGGIDRRDGHRHRRGIGGELAVAGGVGERVVAVEVGGGGPPAELGKCSHGFLLDGVIEVEIAKGDMLVGHGILEIPEPVLRLVVSKGFLIGVFLLLENLDGSFASLAYQQGIQFGNAGGAA